MKFYTGLIMLLFSCLFAKSQEHPKRTNIIKVYPFSALKDEYRIGLERGIKKGKSMEFGVGYLYRTFEKAECNECYYPLLALISYGTYKGKGASIRLNWIDYNDSTKQLKGSYTSVGLIYKFLLIDKPEYVSRGPGLYGTDYFANQNAIYLQMLWGKQFISNNIVVNFYGGLSGYFELNYYNYFGPYPMQYHLKNNPSVSIGPSINFGLSFGYKSN